LKAWGGREKIVWQKCAVSASNSLDSEQSVIEVMRDGGKEEISLQGGGGNRTQEKMFGKSIMTGASIGRRARKEKGRLQREGRKRGSHKLLTIVTR